MERQPIKTIPIHEHLRPRLCDTYENDSIFDKFEVVFSGDTKNVMTGSYNNNFMIYPSDPDKEVEVVLQADKSAFKAKKVGVPTPINGGGKKGRSGSPATGNPGRMRKETDADQIDFNKKILHMSWHPFEDSIAIAATNNVSLLYSLITIFKANSYSSLYFLHYEVITDIEMMRVVKGILLFPPNDSTTHVMILICRGTVSLCFTFFIEYFHLLLLSSSQTQKTMIISRSR